MIAGYTEKRQRRTLPRWRRTLPRWRRCRVPLRQ